MKQKIFFISLCYVLLSVMSEYTVAQVTRADYLRADTVSYYARLVYSSSIQPEWIDSLHYFWYQNHEKDGEFFYLVDAEKGEKYRADNKAGLVKFFPQEKRAEIESFLQKEKHRSQTMYHKEEERKGIVSPDKCWETYIKDYNVYIVPLQKEGRREIALTMDGTERFRYDDRSLAWSPDSRKLATVKVRETEERRIPLIESSPDYRKQPVLQWRNYAKPGDVLPICLPVLFDVVGQKQIPLETALYENQYALYLTGWRSDSRAFTFEFNQRGHQRYIVGEVSATDGSIRHLVDEQSPTFIYYNNNFRYDLNDGKELLWISERDG